MKLINPNNDLLLQRNLNPLNIHTESPEIINDVQVFKQEIANGIENNFSILPTHPGFERHPYKGLLTNSDASKYIIGTFPPISYFIDTLNNEGYPIEKLKQPSNPHQTIDKPKIPFFHGNVNALWSVLLTPNELNTLNMLVNIHRNEAKQFLIDILLELGIYYDDIILLTQRSLGNIKPNNNLGYTYEDVNLKNISPDLDLVKTLLDNPKLEVVCFTNGATFRSGNDGGLKLYNQMARLGFVRTGNSDALSLFLRTCQEIGLGIEMRCMPHFNWTHLNQLTAAQKRTKLIFELRFTRTPKCTLKFLNTFRQKEITVITPYSPAAHGTIENHPIVNALKQMYGINHSSTQLLPFIYTHFRNGSYNELFQFNINI